MPAFLFDARINYTVLEHYTYTSLALCRPNDTDWINSLATVITYWVVFLSAKLLTKIEKGSISSKTYHMISDRLPEY